MRCSRCGSTNPEDARFCGNCGLPACQSGERPEVHPPERQEPEKLSPVICPNCGATGIPRGNACAHCGNRLGASPVTLVLQPTELASTLAPPALARRQLGDFVSETIRLYRKHPRVFLAIAVVPQLPGLVGLAVPTLAAQVVFTILGFVLAAIAQGAVIFAVASIYSGLTPSPATSFQRALKLGSTLVICQIVLVVLLIPVAFLSIFLIGIPLLIFILVLLAFYPQAVVLEKMGVIASFRRSAALVKGDWWRLFGIGSCYGFVVAVPLVLALLLSGGANAVLGVLVTSFAATLALPWMFIGATLVYFDLRLRKEDFTLETLAREITNGPPDTAQKNPR